MLWLLSVWPFLIPIAAAFYMFWLGWTQGGDPQRDSATVQYGPPDNLSPAECGALLDNAIALRCVAATIVDLSVKGYLAIEPGAAGGRPREDTDNPGYVFHMIRPASDWEVLKAHEHAVLSAIFLPTNPLRLLMEAMTRLQTATENSPGSASKSALLRLEAKTTEDPALRALAEAGKEAHSTVTLSEAQDHFYLHRTAIANCVFDALIASGYYARRPDMVRLLYVASATMIGLLMVGIGLILAAMRTPWQSWILSGVLTTAIIVGFGWFMPARSLSGVRALAKVRGFASFLARVEKDHIERMETSPELFEKYLPYAMALRVENKWAQTFARIAVQQPHWYRGRGSDFLSPDLVKELGAIWNRVSPATTPTDSPD